MEISGFYPDIGGDRLYTDDFLAEWVASFISNGVYNAELAVTAGENMQAVLQPGRAWINGRYYRNTEALPIALDNSDGVLNRYTSIMLRADKNNRIINAKAVNSTYSASPVPVNVTRDSEIYDIKIADISVKAGAIAITQADISDTRLNNDVCGIVHGVLTQIDTSTLGLQLENWFVNYRELITQSYAQYLKHLNTNETDAQKAYEDLLTYFQNYESNAVTGFEAWVASLKGKLDTDTAGHLQLEIDALTQRVQTLEDYIANMYKEAAWLGGAYLGAAYLVTAQ